MKLHLGLHLLKLCRENYWVLFSGHGVEDCFIATLTQTELRM